MTNREPCRHCQRLPARRLAVPGDGRAWFCSARCATRWAIRMLERRWAREVSAGAR